MHLRDLLLVCSLSWVVFAKAQHIPRAPIVPVPKPHEPDVPDVPEIPDVPEEPVPNNGGSSPAKATAVGAIGSGMAPDVAEEDSEIDIVEIGEKLEDLLESILSLVTSSTSSDDSQPTATITAASLPYSAYPCDYARGAYMTCSSAYSNFTDLPRTEQAGCLCNAYDDIDSNGDMQSCYSFALSYNATAASNIANGTALCVTTTTTSVDCDVTHIAGLGSDCPSPTYSDSYSVTSPTPYATITSISAAFKIHLDLGVLRLAGLVGLGLAVS